MLPPLPLPADLLDVSAVARMWRVHVSCVYRHIHKKKLTAWRIGGRWRVSEADARAAIRRSGPEAAVKKAEGVPRMGHEAAMRLLRERGVIRS